VRTGVRVGCAGCSASMASSRSGRPTCSSRPSGKLRACPMGTAWDKWACCSRPETSRPRCSPDFRSRTGLSVRWRYGNCRRQVPLEHGPHTAHSTPWDCMRPATPARPRNPIAPCDRPRRSYPPLRRRLPRPFQRHLPMSLRRRLPHPFQRHLPMSLRRCLPHPFQRHLPTNAQQYRRLQRCRPLSFRRCRRLQRHRPTCLLQGVRRRDRKSRRNQRHLLHRRFRWCHPYPSRNCPSCLPHPRSLRSDPYRPLRPDSLQPNSLQASQPDPRPRRSEVDGRRSSRKVRRPNQTPEAGWMRRARLVKRELFCLRLTRIKK
jgi:hypothetical protein